MKTKNQLLEFAKRLASKRRTPMFTICPSWTKTKIKETLVEVLTERRARIAQHLRERRSMHVNTVEQLPWDAYSATEWSLLGAELNGGAYPVKYLAGLPIFQPHSVHWPKRQNRPHAEVQQLIEQGS